jgi:hypothetical protein
MEHNGFLIGNFKVVVPKVRFAIQRKIGRTGGRKIKRQNISGRTGLEYRKQIRITVNFINPTFKFRNVGIKRYSVL